MSVEAYNSEQEKTIKRIQRITARLEKLFGLDQEWAIKHYFDPGYDGDGEIEEGGKSSVSVYTTTAVTAAAWQYKRANIRWFLGTCCKQSDEDLRAVAIHEYVHCLNNPIACNLKHNKYIVVMEEHATELIAQVFNRLVKKLEEE